MNPDDYDEDGNNIVPCPICLNVYCASKEDGKCPGEEQFTKDMNDKIYIHVYPQTKTWKERITIITHVLFGWTYHHWIERKNLEWLITKK